MNYQIFKKEEVLSKPLPFEIFEEGKFNDKRSDVMNVSESNFTKGVIDLKDLKGSKFNTLISKIPEENMQELNKKGFTEYSIIRTQTVQIRK